MDQLLARPRPPMPALRVDVLTLFPNLFHGLLDASLLGKACRKGIVDVRLHDFRAHAPGPHAKVDDKPYGGGRGMVLACQPILDCLEAIDAIAPEGSPAKPVSERPALVMLTPQGTPLTQRTVERLAARDRLVLLCGRYEGFDDRLRTILAPHGLEEVSIGDYILTGGEPAAIVLIDAVSRLVPGVLAHDASHEFESFDARLGLLDYPVYTKPPVVRGHEVPAVLTSGDHQAVANWRLDQALARTRTRRPDLARALDQSPDPVDRAEWLAALTGVTREKRKGVRRPNVERKPRTPSASGSQSGASPPPPAATPGTVEPPATRPPPGTAGPETSGSDADR